MPGERHLTSFPPPVIGNNNVSVDYEVSESSVESSHHPITPLTACCQIRWFLSHKTTRTREPAPASQVSPYQNDGSPDLGRRPSSQAHESLLRGGSQSKTIDLFARTGRNIVDRCSNATHNVVNGCDGIAKRIYRYIRPQKDSTRLLHEEEEEAHARNNSLQGQLIEDSAIAPIETGAEDLMSRSVPMAIPPGGSHKAFKKKTGKRAATTEEQPRRSRARAPSPFPEGKQKLSNRIIRHQRRTRSFAAPGHPDVNEPELLQLDLSEPLLDVPQEWIIASEPTLNIQIAPPSPQPMESILIEGDELPVLETAQARRMSKVTPCFVDIPAPSVGSRRSSTIGKGHDLTPALITPPDENVRQNGKERPPGPSKRVSFADGTKDAHSHVTRKSGAADEPSALPSIPRTDTQGERSRMTPKRPPPPRPQVRSGTFSYRASQADSSRVVTREERGYIGQHGSELTDEELGESIPRHPEEVRREMMSARKVEAGM